MERKPNSRCNSTLWRDKQNGVFPYSIPGVISINQTFPTFLITNAYYAFWRNGQNIAFNSLQKLTTCEGYLVNMNVAGTLLVTGMPVETQNFVSLQLGWQLIGCPYQTATSLSTLFNTTNCQVVKNFDGFWIPSGTINSITTVDPGKGYFLKK